MPISIQLPPHAHLHPTPLLMPISTQLPPSTSSSSNSPPSSPSLLNFAPSSPRHPTLLPQISLSNPQSTQLSSFIAISIQLRSPLRSTSPPTPPNFAPSSPSPPPLPHPHSSQIRFLIPLHPTLLPQPPFLFNFALHPHLHPTPLPHPHSTSPANNIQLPIPAHHHDPKVG